MNNLYKLTVLLMLLLVTATVLPVTSQKVKSVEPVAPRAPMFLSPQFAPIVSHANKVFVTNTPSGTLDVLDARSRKVTRRISVGIEPVSLAVRPDGKEIWVANHVSDSVSVVDIDSASPTYLSVIATVQDFDPQTRATRFDEPVGIAFASNQKAYVALSSQNQIAVVDTLSRQVTKHLAIPAQDPRAIIVRGERLYVLPFESGNQTQLSGGIKPFDNNLVTFDAYQHSIFNNNVLSLGHIVDIVKHPSVPDRDLFVFDTKTDQLLQATNTLGTLLYGLAVDSKGKVFIAQTDARNDVNGRTGTKKHGLKELENRPFLNQITCIEKGGSRRFDLEPLPPAQPAPDKAFATPFALQITDDDKTLVATASGSDILFTLDANSGAPLGRVSVGAVPQGVTLEGGKRSRAWVLNAAENSVSVVDVSDLKNPKLLTTVPLSDPTPAVMKRGRIAFSTASASSTGTFSCASCHPDGHTDQLLWTLDTPIVTGGNQIMPRSTMPVRGLRDTAPFHWDGIPGDPYGGNNSAHIFGRVAPNADPNRPETSTRFLIDAGLASTMRLAGDTAKNDEGKQGRLSRQQRDDMAAFLLDIPYPPAPRRAYDNTLSARAQQGFRLFHIDGDNDPTKSRPNVCGDCHRMPFLASTNTPGTGMDAPTWRGAYDRWLILPQGRLNIIGFDFYKSMAERGAPEREVWQMSWGGRPRFNPVWDMVLEQSTGFHGTFARQLTLNQSTARDAQTSALLAAMEQAARDGAVALRGEGVRLSGKKAHPLALSFDGKTYAGISPQELVEQVAEGKLILTLTAHLTGKPEGHTPQPALWTFGPIQNQRGHEVFPLLYPGSLPMKLSGRHIQREAKLLVDGHVAAGTLTVTGETVLVSLKSLPSTGLHFLQLQNPDGQLSNDFVFHVAPDAKDDRALLIDAVLYNDTARVENLLAHGAPVNGANDDGNTALHVASFFCHIESVDILLKHGADPTRKNGRGETAVDSVGAAWSQGLAAIYTGIADAVGLPIDLMQLQQARPKLAQKLRMAK